MSVNKLLKDIENLVTPLNEKTFSFEDALDKKLTDMMEYELFKVRDIAQDLGDFTGVNFKNNATWLKFLQILLDKMLLLKNEVECDSSHLFSISQQRMLKSTIEIIICMGVLPHLSQGIGCPLSQRLSEKSISLFKKDTPEDEKYYALNITLLALFELNKLDTFNSILINHHLGDIIAGTVQLIIDKRAVEPEIFKQNLQFFVENTYQPYAIRALMTLGNKGAPRVLVRWLNKVLSERLTSSGGVIATIRAILDMCGDSKDSPLYWEHVALLAKIITLPKHSTVYPQLFSLLKGENSEYRRVAVLCVKLLSESRPDDCQKYFVSPLLNPVTSPSSEADFGAALEAIHACCGLQTPWSLPPRAISSAFPYFIRLHAKIRTSASYLKSKASDLAWAILSNDDTNLEEIFLQSVFDPLPVSFQFGSEGGIYVSESEDETLVEDVADSILDLFTTHNISKSKLNLFKTLIDCITKEKTLEKQLLISKTLSDLCGDTDVQKSLTDDPLCIVPFMKVLLEDPESYGCDIVCLGLMVLGIVVDTPYSHKPMDWPQLNELVEPLKNFKSSNTEANVLANELYEMIITRGVVRKKPKTVEKVQTNLEKALEEAVDPLLPVRAHGIKELGKLLLAKDPQTLAKKETIFFIFKENLKDEDSFIYLSCIEGLAALSASFPDEVILILIEEYQTKNHSVEDRLKVGEVLIKVARILNEMAIIYKKELISCSLVGCYDDDPLLRASSLSNLGEICKILSFRITAYVVEILECVRSIYETDKYVEPRRAAVMALTLLLKGLGQSALHTLEPILLELYRGLKKVYTCDKDEVTRLHAQLALEELRASTLVFLNPPLPMEKRIYVLDSPPQ